MLTDLHAPVTHLLTLSDGYGELLADFDYFTEQELLYVRWHGHLTAANVVRGAQAGLELGATGPSLRRILNDKSHSTGSWDEALPWFHYDWLPRALAGGVQALAYVLSPDPHAQPAAQEFLEFARQQMAVSIFRSSTTAWLWLLRH